MLIPLHLPSHWSIGHGVASVPELVAWAAARALPALALTDLENLSGAVEFHHRCRASGIRPILGVELRRGFLSSGRRSHPGARAGRLVLLARNATGYRSLCRIVSRRRADRSADPGADPAADLLLDSEGLFALTDDVAAAARLLRGGFPRRFLRLLLVRPARSAVAERAVLEGARRWELPLVADYDAVGLGPGDEELLRLGRAIALGAAYRSTPTDGYREMPDPERVRFLFADVPEAVSEAGRVAERCASDVLPRGAGAPAADLAPGETAGSRIREITRAALARARSSGRLAGLAYDERLERELRTIKTLEVAHWFLALDAIAAFARERRIEVLGRGSAVGSLVVHLLGLGRVDPVAQGLLFERFLRPGRPAPFDVDLDLPTRRREEVIDWVLGRWGECAAPVGAHQRFGPRSASREAEAAMEPDGGTDEGLPKRLIGSPRGIAVHPGGVVLAGVPIRDIAPLEMAPKGIAVTQLDGGALDAIGIVKLDFLGNTCLDEIDRATALLDPHSEEAGSSQRIPSDDPATLSLLGRGDTVGISQIETPATRAALRRRPIRSIEDLTAALASVRPGPSKKTGPFFEEDVMRLLSLDAALSLEETDAWRAAIVATSGDAEALSTLGRRFTATAIARGIPRERANAAWAEASPFASYAFSKAHAASYALLAYRAAFLRAHHPLEWACAVLDAHGGAYLDRTIASEIARWGIRIRPPAINESGPRTRIRERKDLLLGVDRIRGVSDRTKAAILVARERTGTYRSLADLVARVQPDRREIEALVLSGACDRIDPLSSDGYPFVHEALLEALRSGSKLDEIPVLTWRVPPEGPLVAEDELRRFRHLVRARNELRYLGLAPSGHPLGILRDRSARDGCRTIAEVLADDREREVAVAALPAATRRVETRGGPMRFVTWEDETGLLESRIAPAAHARLGSRFRPDGAFRVAGAMRFRGPLRRLDVEALLPLGHRSVSS